MRRANRGSAMPTMIFWTASSGWKAVRTPLPRARVRRRRSADARRVRSRQENPEQNGALRRRRQLPAQRRGTACKRLLRPNMRARCWTANAARRNRARRRAESLRRSMRAQARDQRRTHRQRFALGQVKTARRSAQVKRRAKSRRQPPKAALPARRQLDREQLNRAELPPSMALLQAGSAPARRRPARAGRPFAAWRSLRRQTCWRRGANSPAQAARRSLPPQLSVGAARARLAEPWRIRLPQRGLNRVQPLPFRRMHPDRLQRMRPQRWTERLPCGAPCAQIAPRRRRNRSPR